MLGVVLAVALDVDGVLIDSASVHRQMWKTWAQRNGLEVGVVWEATFGRRPQDTVREVAPGLRPAQEVRELDRLLAAREHRIEALPGAAALLDALATVLWAVVTSGSRPITMRRFGRLGLPMPPVAGSERTFGGANPRLTAIG
jgi:sugar-phosphatase